MELRQLDYFVHVAELGSGPLVLLGLLISMRALSKYWTVRTPPMAPAKGSVRLSPGPGPHSQEREASPRKTGRSVRDHTLSKRVFENEESSAAGEAGEAGER